MSGKGHLTPGSGTPTGASCRGKKNTPGMAGVSGVAATPSPAGRGTPVPASRGAPVPASRGAPVPASRGAPVPASRGAPVPVSRGAPVPASRGAPVPAGRGMVMATAPIVGPGPVVPKQIAILSSTQIQNIGNFATPADFNNPAGHQRIEQIVDNFVKMVLSAYVYDSGNPQPKIYNNEPIQPGFVPPPGPSHTRTFGYYTVYKVFSELFDTFLQTPTVAPIVAQLNPVVIQRIKRMISRYITPPHSSGAMIIYNGTSPLDGPLGIPNKGGAKYNYSELVNYFNDLIPIAFDFMRLHCFDIINDLTNINYLRSAKICYGMSTLYHFYYDIFTINHDNTKGATNIPVYAASKHSGLANNNVQTFLCSTFIELGIQSSAEQLLSFELQGTGDMLDIINGKLYEIKNSKDGCNRADLDVNKFFDYKAFLPNINDQYIFGNDVRKIHNCIHSNKTNINNQSKTSFPFKFYYPNKVRRSVGTPLPPGGVDMYKNLRTNQTYNMDPITNANDTVSNIYNNPPDIFSVTNWNRNVFVIEKDILEGINGIIATIRNIPSVIGDVYTFNPILNSNCSDLTNANPERRYSAQGIVAIDPAYPTNYNFYYDYANTLDRFIDNGSWFRCNSWWYDDVRKVPPADVVCAGLSLRQIFDNSMNFFSALSSYRFLLNKINPTFSTIMNLPNYNELDNFIQPLTNIKQFLLQFDEKNLSNPTNIRAINLAQNLSADQSFYDASTSYHNFINVLLAPLQAGDIFEPNYNNKLELLLDYLNKLNNKKTIFENFMSNDEPQYLIQFINELNELIINTRTQYETLYDPLYNLCINIINLHQNIDNIYKLASHIIKTSRVQDNNQYIPNFEPNFNTFNEIYTRNIYSTVGNRINGLDLEIRTLLDNELAVALRVHKFLNIDLNYFLDERTIDQLYLGIGIDAVELSNAYSTLLTYLSLIKDLVINDILSIYGIKYPSDMMDIDDLKNNLIIIAKAVDANKAPLAQLDEFVSNNFNNGVPLPHVIDMNSFNTDNIRNYDENVYNYELRQIEVACLESAIITNKFNKILNEFASIGNVSYSKIYDITHVLDKFPTLKQQEIDAIEKLLHTERVRDIILDSGLFVEEYVEDEDESTGIAPPSGQEDVELSGLLSQLGLKKYLKYKKKYLLLKEKVDQLKKRK